MRIIAGKYRGLKLKSFEADNIRPTLIRAREGVFNKLQFIITDSSVLDLFGGTGAISIEFLSRGAQKVITCDCDKRSVDLIKSNFKLINCVPNIVFGDYIETLKLLKTNGDRFDIIFLDPPFKSDFGLKAIEFIFDNQLLAIDGIVVFEHSSLEHFNYELYGYNLIDSKKYGYITIDYFKWCENV